MLFNNKYILYVATLFLLSACNSTAKINVMDVSIQAADFLNPNIYNQTSPIVISIYQLKSSANFQQANFFSLYTDPIKALGVDMLDKRELEIQPKTKQEFVQNLSLDTNYIGLVAAYRDPDKSQWRQLISVKSGQNIKLKINLQTLKLVAKTY